ncbi:hypothetical protein [Pseudomonas guariconensis]|uniref:hypothetical protein n=1 Tax=Pseudomonas guariconensis TaxID=1288410 RepID=UPI0018AC3841|nr:hypothetical protein [Pseudomonas guariconensis]MBF8720217.1 hypothetical protein [Pseudomonas guariconensis]
MNGGAITDQRSAVLAQLNASIDNFFLNGGSVQSLPASEYVPRRPHRDLEPARLVKAPLSKRAEKRKQRLEEIRALAKRMTYAETMAHTGLSQSCLVRAASEGKFKFQPDPRRGKGKLGKKLSDPVADREKADQIIAYRNLCLSRYRVVRLMKISDKQLKRLLREFDIDFPTTAEKRALRTA